MTTNEYPPEKRIAQNQISSRSLDQVDEGEKDSERVDGHVITHESEWVPGKHPEPDYRYEGQTEYVERYLRCVDCGVEVLREADLPEECDPK